ncbi:MAG TPA: bifunctional lytic transglycosylase/C40 family peptidase [Gaiellaceae bacterium]
MRRLLPLFGALLVLASVLSSTAMADTFRVVQPHPGTAGSAGATMIPFTSTQPRSGGTSFAALRPIWQAAGTAYGIPWEVLGAINKVETNFGQNLGPSSAGAVGWMQFMPSTWARWGVDANGDGVADPNNPTDAIFGAARYLAGCGGQFDIARAVYCYNHATWYVNEVLGLASLYGAGGGGGATGFAISPSKLKAQLASARSRVSASHALLGNARAQAARLARAERRFLRVANTARVLSNQLEARKRAVQAGVRRQAAEARVNQLRRRLDAATTQLGQFRDEASPSFGTNAPALLSSKLFSVGDGSAAPYSGIVSLAMQYLGIPYKWGGASPTTGFDCSGLVQYVYAQVGISLPHYTVSQWNYRGAVAVPKDRLQPGDLVFFNGLDHVGIYIGYGDFIDAPHTGSNVEIDSLSERWFASRYDGARRILGAAAAGLSRAATTATFTSAGSTAFSSDIVYFTH